MTAVLSRRGVLTAGAVAVGVGLASTTAPAVAATSPAPERRSTAEVPVSVVDPALPTRSVFTGLDGASFTGSSQFAVHELVLLDVADLPGGGDSEQRFAVTFTTTDGARDGIYRLTRGGEHVATLFLSRVGDHPALQGIVDRGAEA